MTAFGCRPVPYNVSDEYEADLASGDMSGLTGFVADAVGVVGTPLPDDIIPPTGKLQIKYHRAGIVAPMPSSVQSVALAVNLVEEVESQYGSVKGSATETMVFGIIQSVLAGGGIALSTAQIIADAVGVAEAIGIAAACLGLCVNEYAAAALYVASIAVSGVALVVNTAAMATLIAGTVQAGQVLWRLSGEDEAIEKMKDFCERKDSALPDEIMEGLAESIENLKNQRDRAKQEMDDAKAVLDADKEIIEACRANLGTALAEYPPLEGGGTCSAGTYAAICPALANYEDLYADFLQEDPSSPYQALYDAEQALAGTEKGMAAAQKKMEATDTTKPAVQAQIEAAVLQFPPKDRDARREELKERYKQEYQEAAEELGELESDKPTQQTAVTNAQNALDDEIKELAAPVPGSAPCNNEGTVDCAGKYQELCGDAYVLISTPVTKTHDMTYTVTYPVDDQGHTQTYTYTETYNHTFSGQFHVDWTDHESKKEWYESASANYETLANVKLPAAEQCKSIDETDRQVEVWPVEAAVEVLRRVDKRSVLQ
jgi:hypothetical protein